MNSTKKSTTDQKGRLESFITSRRKFSYSHIVSEVSFWLALIVAFVSGGSIISRTTSEFYSAILSVSLTVGGILVFAFWTLRERSIRRREVFKLLKTRHTDFFDWVKSDVARLIEKGRTDEGILTGSAK